MPAVLAVVALAAYSCAAEAKREVKVSDFGWNPEDSTEFVQAALDSGAKRVVFDRKDGPWVVRPVKARSGTEIVFEDGVELVAKKGEFHGKRDYLLDMTDLSDITLAGLGEKGGVLRMNKADYQKPPYAPSEWRYALSLLGTARIRVENMSFVSSGGDGICLGRPTCRDVTIRRCRFIDNHRQGISVCSATNLLIEDCIIKGTSGTAPSAGIDFEPDRPTGNIVNCTVRDCLIEGNAGKGIDMFLRNQTAASNPIGIRIENCVIKGNSSGTAITLGGDGFERNPPRGSVVFSNCTFNANRGGAVLVHRKPTGFPLVFDGCVMTNSEKGVSMFNYRWDAPVPDGIEFRNLVVHCGDGQDWYTPRQKERGLNAALPTNITGNVTVIRPNGRREKRVIDREWCRRTFSIEGETPPARVPGFPSVKRCRVCDAKPGEMAALSQIELMWGARYAFFADHPGTVRFRGRYVPKSPGVKRPPAYPIAVKRFPSAKQPLVSVPSPGFVVGELAVKVPSRGFYFMEVPRTSGARFLLEESDTPVALYVVERQQQAFISDVRVRSLYVWVPEGTDRFAFIFKSGTDSALGAELFDPEGASVACNRQIEQWSVLQSRSPANGLWRLDITKPSRGARRYFQLDFTGLPALLWLSPEKFVSY